MNVKRRRKTVLPVRRRKKGLVKSLRALGGFKLQRLDEPI